MKRGTEAAIAAAVLCIDQGAKLWARGLTAPLPLIPGILQARHTENTGVAFSLLSSMPRLTGLLTVVLLIAAALLLRGRAGEPIGRTGAALAFGGAIGNLIDRLLHGSVTDWIEPLFMRFAVFNIADAALVIGIALVIYSLFRSPDAWNRQPKPGDSEEPEEP